MPRNYKTDWRRRFTVLLGAAKSRGKQPVQIDRDYLLAQLAAQNHRCYYSGVELTLNAPNRYDSVSIDRLDNSLGYVPGNVVITIWRINRAKSNLSAQDFISMCRTVISNQPSSERLTHTPIPEPISKDTIDPCIFANPQSRIGPAINVSWPEVKVIW